MNRGKVTLYLDRTETEALKKIAKGQDTSASRIIRQLVRDYLRDYKAKKKKK